MKNQNIFIHLLLKFTNDRKDVIIAVTLQQALFLWQNQ